MRLIFFVLILFLIGFFFPFSFFGAKAEVFLLLTLYFALQRGVFVGSFCGFGFGILQELLSSASFGTLLIPSVLVGFLAGQFRERLYFENVWHLSFLVFFAIIFGYLIQFIFSGNFSFFMVWSALFSTAISPILFLIIKRCG